MKKAKQLVSVDSVVFGAMERAWIASYDLTDQAGSAARKHILTEDSGPVATRLLKAEPDLVRMVGTLRAGKAVNMTKSSIESWRKMQLEELAEEATP